MRGSGHRGAILDMSMLLENCQDVADLTFQPLLDQMKDLLTTRISSVIDCSELAASTRDAFVADVTFNGSDLFVEGENERDWWIRVITTLASKELWELNHEMRLRLLFWTCDEMLSNSSIKILLEETVDNRAKVDRESKSRLDEIFSVNEDSADLKNLAFSRSGRRIAPAAPSIAENQPLVRKSKSLGRKRKSTNLSDASEYVMEVDICRARQEPIGKDRDGSLYWVFFDDCMSLKPQLYCQRFLKNSSEWLLFSSAKDISTLKEWLNDKCRNEAKLKSFIDFWASENVLDNSLNSSSPTSILPSDTIEPLNLTEELAAFHRRLRVSKETGEFEHPVTLVIQLQAKELGGMGFELKAKDGIVYVSTISSCSDLRVGDIIISVEQHYVTSTEIIQDKLKEITSKRTSSKLVLLSFLRYSNPLACPYFRELVFADKDLAIHFLQQDSLHNSSSERTIPMEQPKLPNALLGDILHIILSLNNPFAMTHRWLNMGLRSEMIKVLSSLRAVIDWKGVNKSGYTELHASIVETMTSILISLTEGLEERSTMLSPAWDDQSRRVRSRWRLSCRRCRTYSQVSVCVAVLRCFIEWRHQASLFEPIIRNRWLELVDASMRTQGLPVTNELLLYYGEGHRRYADVDLPQWGETLKGTSDAVFTCRVTDIECFAAGPSSFSSKCYPFMLVSIDPSGVTLSSDQYLTKLRPSSDSRAMLSRLLDRILSLLTNMPDFEPFLQPVSPDAFPDYHTVVDSPLCLNDMIVKINSYVSVSAFRNDIELIRSNCHCFCTNTFPEMVGLADRLLSTAEILISDFREELELAEQSLTNGAVKDTENKQEVCLDDGDAEMRTNGSQHNPINQNNGQNGEGPLYEENLDTRFPSGSTFCVRLNSGYPLFVVKRFKYEAALETIANLELETRFKMRAVIDGMVTTRYVRIYFFITTFMISP